MAEKKPESVDQGKVAKEAGKLAEGKPAETLPNNLPPAETTPAPDPNPKTPEVKPATPAPVETISEDEADAQVHEKLTKQFGTGYVEATRGKEETVFSARTWERMGPNKEGWKVKTKKPKEVKDLEAKNQK